MLPTVPFCGLNITRLIIGANPFGGFSHQNRQRDIAMREFHTPEQIRVTWERAWASGINVMITNNESANVMDAVRRYMADGGPMTWIAQVNRNKNPDMLACIREAVEIGAKALYIHGGVVDKLYIERDAGTIRDYCKCAHDLGVRVGVAGHDPRDHDWIADMDIVDFHNVCFFNCGSVHFQGGERFLLCDMPEAIKRIQKIQKPCIAYKIMGSGRIDPRMAFQHAFASIKPIDAVNVGMHRGDKDNIVEENVAMVRSILGEPAMVA